MIAVSVQQALESGLVEDTLAAMTICGLLMFIGIMTLFAVFRSRGRKSKFDAEKLTTVALAHWIGGSGDSGGGAD